MRSRRAGRKRKARHASSTLVVQTSYDSFPMAANGSSANMANIITALGNAFKDPSGATMSNDRLAAVLLQNMSQLTDLAKQGKLNQQQIMQVRRTLLTCEFPAHHQRMFTFPGVPSCGITQTSTSPPRQSRYLRGTHIFCPNPSYVSCCSQWPVLSPRQIYRLSRRRREAHPPQCSAKAPTRRTRTRSVRR